MKIVKDPNAEIPGDWHPVDHLLLDDPDEARAFALREVSGSRGDDEAGCDLEPLERGGGRA